MEGHFMWRRSTGHKSLDIIFVFYRMFLVMPREVDVKGELPVISERYRNSDRPVLGEQDPLELTAKVIFRLPVVADSETIVRLIPNGGQLFVVERDIKPRSARHKKDITLARITPKCDTTFDSGLLVKPQLDAVEVFQFVCWSVVVAGSTRGRLTADRRRLYISSNIMWQSE